MTATCDAAVIGGGIAGLSAAVRLAGSGLRVAVFEARPGLGGRATAFKDPVTGEWVDNGQHLLLGCYHETFRFLDAIGARDSVRIQPSLEAVFVDAAGVRSTLACPPLPSPLHLLAGLMEWEALGFRDWLSAFAMVRPIRLAQRQLRRGDVIAASPGETVESWLVRNGQTRRLIEMLWEPLALAALNQPLNEAAAPAFARVLAQMLGPDPRDAAVGIPLRPLHELYADPARAFIERHGGAVHTTARAWVACASGRATGVRTRDGLFEAAHVVAAVPWFAFGSLFDPLPDALRAIARDASRLGSSPIVTVNLWLDGAVMDAPFVGLPGRTFQWVFDKRQLVGEELGHLSLVCSGAAEVVGFDNETLAARARAELSRAVPASRRARHVRFSVVRERRATFSLAPGAPPRPAVETPLEGLYLAGDWIETGLPGTIESAVVSGHLAAERVLAHEGTRSNR